MKTIIILLFAALVACAAFAAYETTRPAVPQIDQATQIEVLATNLELSAVQAAAAPYLDAVKKAAAAAQPAGDKATKACNPKGGAKYQFTLQNHKVVCVEAPAPPPAAHTGK